jgi:hypothetical protein
MSDGYLSKDRDHLNRMQRERRAGLVRIDYHPDADALAMIEAKRPAYGPDSTNSAVLNAIVREWAEATGIKCREVERPETSGDSGVSRHIAQGRASESGNAGTFAPLTRTRVTPGASGIPEDLQPTRASKSGRELRKWERVQCGGKRRRDGQPCQALSVPGKRRCKWHGGASTGPKTPEGKERAKANLLAGRSSPTAKNQADS